MLYGREREIERIEHLLGAARAGMSDAVILRGDPGVGKTALLRHAVERAESMLVLRATGYESEAQLEFSGLVEVCRPLLGGLDALPAVQAAALSSALGLAEPARNDRFAVAAATLSLVAGAAEELPVLVLIDDAHWLDDASLDALLFVARRLVVDSVAFLFATRPEGLERNRARGARRRRPRPGERGAGHRRVGCYAGRCVRPRVAPRGDRGQSTRPDRDPGRALCGSACGPRADPAAGARGRRRRARVRRAARGAVRRCARRPQRSSPDRTGARLRPLGRRSRS